MTGYNMEKGYEDDINHSGIVDIRPFEHRYRALLLFLYTREAFGGRKSGIVHRHFEKIETIL